MLTNQADRSLDSSSLTYRDPTGNQAVRNLEPGQYAITDPHGFTIWIDAEELKPALCMYVFTATRAGANLRARLKEKTPGVSYSSSEGENRTEPLSKERIVSKTISATVSTASAPILATVTGPTGRTVEPEELLMQILVNGDNDLEFSNRADYIIAAA